MRKASAVVGALVWAAATFASAPIEAAAPKDRALVGARIVVAPGRTIDVGTVIVRDGVIVAVGGEIAVPEDLRITEGDGLTAYPGLIDAYTVAPWPEPEESDDAPALQGGHDNALVTPERDMGLHAFDDGRFQRLRAAGFTTAVVAPQQGLIRGTSALVNLGEGGLGTNLLRRDVAQNLTLRANDFGGGYPSSLMGAEALLRQTFLDARWYAAAHELHTRNPAQARPAHNLALAALGDTVAGHAKVMVETGDVLGTLRWKGLIDELGLDAVAIGNGEEYKRLDAVAALGLPHIVPLDFPDAPDVGSEGDAMTVGLEALRHWHQAPGNPAALLGAGVTTAFTSNGASDPKAIHAHLERAIARGDGLDHDTVLAALTTTPAKLLDIDDIAGTLEPGKMANLVIVEGSLFVESPKIREVWIDGRRHEIKTTKPPTVDPAGTWHLKIDAGDGGSMAFDLVLSGTAESMDGSISTPAGSLPLRSVLVSGATVEMELDSTPLGMPGIVTFEMTVDGDRASGTGQAPPGPFTLTAQRTSGPPEVL